LGESLVVALHGC